jgi:hypothetical protein
MYPRTRIAVIALGMLLSILGHDAIMVTNPHEVETAHAAHHDVGHASSDDVPCGTIEGVRSPSADDLDTDAPAPCLVMSDGMTVAIPVTPEWWSVPDHPPDVKRAMLQVYLN